MHNSNHLSSSRNAFLQAFALGTVIWALFLGFMYLGLGRDWLASDAPVYISQSRNLELALTNPFHVPGFPISIALVRFMTFGVMPDMWIGYLINYLALVASCWAIFELIEGLLTAPVLKFFGPLLFVLWPFVGLNNSVSPLAEVPAMALLLWGMVFSREKRLVASGLLVGLACMFHKGIWPAAFLLILETHFTFKRSVRSTMSFAALASIPLIFIWVAGTIAKQEGPLWIIRSSLAMGAESRHYYIPFEGLWQTLTQDGAKGAVKGTVMIGVILTLFWVLHACRRLPREQRFLGYTVILTALFWFAFLTKLELLAALRFSRLCVVPILWVVSACVGVRESQRAVAVYILVGIVLYLTEFAGAWHVHQKMSGEGVPQSRSGLFSPKQ